MTALAQTPRSAAPPRPVRLGVVSFLNTLPLIDGLENLADVAMRFSVPSLLLDSLVRDEVDLALCSSIDYQRSPDPLVIVPAGLLGSDGPTLTVRLYSTEPIERIREVYCDTDSHTSIALLRMVLREQHDLEPRLIDYDAHRHVAENRRVEFPQAMLLIGDKVVCDAPAADRYPHQLDLGQAWREMTGLPFVFAAWMAKSSADHRRLRAAGAILDRQRRHNRERIGSIIARHAQTRGWPAFQAREYLTQRLTFEFTDSHRAGLELFFHKARDHKLIDSVRPLEFVGV